MANTVKGGIVHRGDATASFNSLANPTGKLRTHANPAHGSPSASTMNDPVKAAGAKLRKGH